MQKQDWYLQAYKQQVTLTFKSLSGHVSTKKGELLLPGTFEGSSTVEIKVNTYNPAGGSYILVVTADRVVNVEYNGKDIWNA